MVCAGCGNPEAYRTRTYAGGAQVCDRCGGLGPLALPDVFWDGMPEHGLADDPVSGGPRVFLSRGQKARYLKEKGLVEAGDRIRGSNLTSRSGPAAADKASARARNRDLARAARAQVRKMGRDVRRQKYLEIKKQAEAVPA